MKIKSVDATPIKTEFWKSGTWKLTEKFVCTILTDEGCMSFHAQPGFVTDMRSGSDAINKVIPKFTGNKIYDAAILVHDMNYTVLPGDEHLVSKAVADDLLYQMALLSGEIGKLKATAMKLAVQLAGDSAYYEPDQPPYDGNGALINLLWGITKNNLPSKSTPIKENP
jgi:hypothetical protein